MKHQPTILFALLFAAFPAQADLQGTMNKLFEKANQATAGTFSGNFAAPGAYEGQTTNYYTGGQLYMRWPHRNYNIASFTPPELNMGCNGIDWHGGSISFMSKEAFVGMLKSFATRAAVGWGFKLAMKSISPNLADLMTDFQNLTKDLNKVNFDACQAAQGGTLASQLDAYGQRLFDDVKKVGTDVMGIFSDRQAGQTELAKNPSQVGNYAQQAAGRDDTREFLPQGNITWRALSKISDANLSQAEKRLMMTLVGAYIYNPTGTARESNTDPGSTPTTGSVLLLEDGSSVTLPSAAKPQQRSNENTSVSAPGVAYVPGLPIRLSELIGSPGMTTAKLRAFSCDSYNPETGCMSPRVPTSDDDVVDFTPFRAIVRARMESIVQAIRAGQPPDASEQKKNIDFVNSTRLPVYKMLAVATSLGGRHTALAEYLMSNYEETIATEYAAQYVGMLLNEVERAVANLAASRIAGGAESIIQLREAARNVREQIAREMQSGFSRAQESSQMVAEVMQYERLLHSSLPAGISSSLNWQRSLGN